MQCVGANCRGEVYFDPAYSGNLVNVMALGLMETEEIVKSGAAGLERCCCRFNHWARWDGGASFASAELSDESEDRPAVQVGDPPRKTD